MGIKGTVRRAQDCHVIHANVDTDIIVAEEAPFGSTRKPEEIYHAIEHFALVRARMATRAFEVLGASDDAPDDASTSSTSALAAAQM